MTMVSSERSGNFRRQKFQNSAGLSIAISVYVFDCSEKNYILFLMFNVFIFEAFIL